MPPDRGRASRACTSCRKQKTRCYESGNRGGGPCLRCERLHQPCSLEIPISQTRTLSSTHGSPHNDNTQYGDRLSRLERTVNTLVERLAENQASRQTSSQATPSRDTGTDFEESGALSSAAPVFVIRDVATELGVGQNQRRPTKSPAPELSADIITKGLLGIDEAAPLLALFHEHYGRWVSFSASTPPDRLLAKVRESPLLLCACCLIAVRHTSLELATRLAPKLFHEAKSLLSSALLVVPQTLSFFQAALILSLWSTTIGQVLLSIDSWLLSGYALQHSFANELFGPVLRAHRSSHLGTKDLERLCIWNHLCLTHLHYCVGTRRKALLDRKQIDQCRKVLDSDHATNFEYRMVAEVNLYWIIYESCSASRVDLPGTQAALHSWNQEWKFLFDQPRSQFLQMGFHFAQLLLYDQSLKSRSAAVRESLLSEMVRLSAAILTLAMETSDDRTRHLTDHIYHIITFAAVTLCRLLNMYEKQLSTSHDIAGLDQLVLTLVTWLHSIGLPCHVAHTLGDVVSAFHEKLRPEARPTPNYEEPDPWLQEDFTLLFPELLGTEMFEGSSDALLPDWDPVIQGPPT